MNEAVAVCRKCNNSLDSESRFCPQCGRSVTERSPKQYILAVAIAAALGFGGWALQAGVYSGTKRPKSHPTMPQKTASKDRRESPQLAAMRQTVKESPNDMQKLKMFAGMLGDELRSNPQAPSELVFEGIEVFGRILQQEPKDPLALVLMADVSFDQKAFTKALDFYKRYLEVSPEDLGARARYASTLTFLGQYDDSVGELEKVLQVEPKNFPAKAYLAITYAQKGDIKTAKAIGDEALALAPSDEARARFSSFVSSLSSVESGESGQAPKVGQRNSGAASGGIEGFVGEVRENPVAGPKLVRHAEKGDSTVVLFFKDFPMDKMPPFAKQKFFAGLRAALDRNTLKHIKRIEFLDAESGRELDVLLTTG
jgi:cytochrome c-type biogenesis protein CcmH/NrfG